MPISEINLKTALEELNMSMDQVRAGVGFGRGGAGFSPWFGLCGGAALREPRFGLPSGCALPSPLPLPCSYLARSCRTSTSSLAPFSYAHVLDSRFPPGSVGCLRHLFQLLNPS
jgi:hypothetical protein